MLCQQLSDLSCRRPRLLWLQLCSAAAGMLSCTQNYPKSVREKGESGLTRYVVPSITVFVMGYNNCIPTEAGERWALLHVYTFRVSVIQNFITQVLLKCQAIAGQHRTDSGAISMALLLITDLVGVHHQVGGKRSRGGHQLLYLHTIPTLALMVHAVLPCPLGWPQCQVRSDGPVVMFLYKQPQPLIKEVLP